MTKEKTQTYFECERCAINTNTKNKMIPCPRGSCEAKAKGIITTTTTITLKLFNHDH